MNFDPYIFSKRIDTIYGERLNAIVSISFRRRRTVPQPSARLKLKSKLLFHHFFTKGRYPNYFAPLF